VRVSGFGLHVRYLLAIRYRANFTSARLPTRSQPFSSFQSPSTRAMRLFVAHAWHIRHPQADLERRGSPFWLSVRSARVPPSPRFFRKPRLPNRPAPALAPRFQTSLSPAAQHSPKEDGWWPKHQAWSGSGLDFGAWTPLDEEWYSSRSTRLNTQAASCVRAKEWKVKLKYRKKEADKFLTSARSLAKSFVREHCV